MATRRETHDGFASSSKRWKYDVFLSFRGIDTRHKFTGHLYMRLKEAGIIAFLDDSDLRRGEVIKEELIKAIEASKISVVVFSKRYGDSRWCLDELVEILGCKKRFNQMVLPIFYDVDPTDIRKQTGSFGEAFDLKHKDKDPKKVQSWRDALTEASNLSGWDLRNTVNGNEPKFIKMIVDQIIAELPSTNLLSVARHPVGINAHLQHLTSRLRIESRDDTRMIGIAGMGGIGKTTLAKAIYNKFYHEFHGKVSFLENVRETAKLHNGLVGLQNQLLADTLKPNKAKVGSVARGKEVIKQRLQRTRVLIVIDDIDEETQLDALAGNCDWFGPGSRIIITTRDQHMIKRVPKGSIYQVQPMHKGEALELFSWHAFGNCCPKEGYLELSTTVVSCCGNLPLALEVIGSLLFGKDTQDWEQEIETLKKIPDCKILEKLRLSYNGLSNSHREKDMFLDIACFFIGMDRNCVTQILDGCDFFAARGIRILLERCLITIGDRNKLMMHDILRDMGREIVRESHLDEPERRSRLWHPKDVEDVLTKNKGTDRIEGLLGTLNLLNPEEKSFTTVAFENITRLRLLQLNYVKLTGNYKHFSKMLRWLCWHGFPLEVIPSDMKLQNLVVLDMRYSKLTRVSEESGFLLEKLKILKLSHSHDLKRSPNFSTVPNLEQLIMKDCRSLYEIHQSIGKLNRLSLVNFQDCKKLMSLPDSFRKLKSIETLVFSGCSSCLAVSLISLLEILQLRTSLADDAAIRHISIPSSISRFESSSLRKLYLTDCNLTDSSIPRWSLKLFTLDLGRNNFENLTNLGDLKVYSLVLSGCSKLRSIEDLPKGMTHLALSYCPALELIPEHPEDTRLILEFLGSRKLIEGSHSDSWLDRSNYIRMGGHYHNIPDAKKILLQGSWNAIVGGGFSFPGNQIPAYCPYVNNRGDPVSFRMPFGGTSVLFLCFVYSSSKSEHESDEGRIVIVNHTNSTCFVAFPEHVYATCSDVKYLWFGNMSNDELHFEAGDRVSIKVVVGEHYEVHKIGVKLIDAYIIDLITKVPLQFAMAERLFGVGSFNLDGGYGNEGNGGYDDYDDYNGDYDDYDDYDGGYGADDIVDEAGPSSGPVKGKRRLGSYTRGECVSQEKQKQRRLSRDEYEDNYADQLIRVLEKNNEMMAAQLEAQNKNGQLEREQNNNNLLAVIKSLTDALVRMADKFPSEKS